MILEITAGLIMISIPYVIAATFIACASGSNYGATPKTPKWARPGAVLGTLVILACIGYVVCKIGYGVYAEILGVIS